MANRVIALLATQAEIRESMIPGDNASVTHPARIQGKIGIRTDIFLTRQVTTMVHPELTVAAVIRHASKYLVIEEWARGRRVLNQPAGHVEPGETIVRAAIREAREESAWRFRPTGFIGLYYWPHEDGRITLRVALSGEVNDHAPQQPLDDGILTTHWMTRRTLARRHDLRSPLVLQSIADFERLGSQSLERLHHMTGAP